MGTHRLASIDSVQAAFAAQRYVADRDLATAVYLSLTLDRPLLVEGEAGVGKTDVGRTLAAVLETELIRLQCYEGLDVNTAVYEWDYPRQMLEIRLLEARGDAKRAVTKDIFSEAFRGSDQGPRDCRDHRLGRGVGSPWRQAPGGGAGGADTGGARQVSGGRGRIAWGRSSKAA